MMCDIAKNEHAVKICSQIYHKKLNYMNYNYKGELMVTFTSLQIVKILLMC